MEGSANGTDCGAAGLYYRGVRHTCLAGFDVTHTYPVAGTSGTTYRVTIHFYGILGPKNYGPGVTREAAPGRPGDQNGGAVPTPWASAPAGNVPLMSDYEAHEIHVDDQNQQEVAIYYVNADTAVGHWTWVLNFEKTIDVIGGGRIRIRHLDPNCRIIKNCGPNGTPANACGSTATARIIDVSAANPAPPATGAAQGGLLQPQLLPNVSIGYSGNWLLMDVIRVGLP
jgi:hypothetical protein